MSLMRKALLAGSTNPWLRDRATKTAFVRRSVARFMPGEQIEDALRAAAGAEAAGHHDHPHEARREPDERRGSRGGHAALSRRARSHRRFRARRAHLGQADAARPRSRSRVVRAESRSARRARRSAQELRLDRHGELAVRRSDDRAVQADAREDRPHRHRAPGVSLSNGAGRRVAGPARRRHPHRQRRVPRAAGRRVSRRNRTWTRTSTSCARGSCAEDARTGGRVAAHRDARHRARRSAVGLHRAAQRPGVGLRVRDAVRHPARPAGSGSRARASACACSSATANTGSRGTCAGWPSARPTCGSSCGPCSGRPIQ